MTTGPGMGIAAPEQIAFAKTSSLWSGKRFYIAALLFLNLFINFMHRINLSVAAPAIARDFHWDAGKMGLLFSFFTQSPPLFVFGGGAHDTGGVFLGGKKKFVFFFFFYKVAFFFFFFFK